ncbi:TRAP transporter small permease [Nocardioides insulae]|uniref:TRAP transporter small permease n=1 Tax=Nocardioides insulae TaxID=394734 RepID=UPI0004186309|nr:TRAP transporter small permease [Nocardioides insulae]
MTAYRDRADHLSTLVRVDGMGEAAEETLTGFRTLDHPGLDRIQNTISGLCAGLAGAALLGIVGLTVAEVVVRAAFDRPLGWNVGLVEQYLMTAMAFFGMVTAYRSSAHIAVATLFERMSGRARKLVMVLGQLVILFALGWLLVAGADAAIFSFRTGEQPAPGTAELPLPTWWWKAIMPVAAGLGMTLVVIDLCRELVGPWDRPATDYAASDVDREISHAGTALGGRPAAPDAELDAEDAR